MLEGKDVLDVGCASGSISKYIAQMGYKVHAIDTLESSIEIANEFFNHENVTYEVRDVIKQPFPENSFDCILFFETIEHVENPAQFLREFHRILRPKGCLILSTPNATSLKNMFYALSYRRRKKKRCPYQGNNFRKKTYRNSVGTYLQLGFSSIDKVT